MGLNSKSHRTGQRLPYAWEDWRELDSIVGKFLSHEETERALVDNDYRLGQFQKPWQRKPKGLNLSVFNEKNKPPLRTYYDIADVLNRAANQTQKQIAENDGESGMRATTKMQEQMNLLIHGQTLYNEYETCDLVTPGVVTSIEGLRIHAVLPIRFLLSVTRGNLELPMNVQKPKDIVAETHGLHIVVSHENPQIQKNIPRGNQMATMRQIQQGYAYGDPIFEGQWGIGLTAPAGETVDLNRDDIHGQILRALPHIAHTILHYPPDNPLIKPT